MLIVSRKTQDHTHHTPAKLALLHSLSSNTLYTLPLASPTPLSPLQNCGKLWFLCGRRSLWCHHAVLCVKQTSLNGAHSAANLENPAKYGVDGSTACRLDSIRATPAQIFRARHHRVRSAEMELSWIIAHEQELNSPQRLRFCSVLWSWSWFVCSRAPGKRSGDQIWSDLDFGGFLCRIVGGRYKGFPPSAQKELLPYVFTCETSSCQLRDRSRHSPELDISTPATCRAQIAAPCWVRAQVREFVKTFPFVVLTQWRLDGIFMMTDPSISQRWWRLLGDELVISLNGQTWFPACNA